MASSVGFPRARSRAAVASTCPVGNKTTAKTVIHNSHAVQDVQTSQSMGWGLLRINPNAAMPVSAHIVRMHNR